MTFSGFVCLQASAEDHRIGAGLVPAHLWDSCELRVLGVQQSENTDAAELPQLCFAAAGLYDCANHPQRLERLTFILFLSKMVAEVCYLFVSENKNYGMQNKLKCLVNPKNSVFFLSKAKLVFFFLFFSFLYR